MCGVTFPGHTRGLVPGLNLFLCLSDLEMSSSHFDFTQKIFCNFFQLHFLKAYNSLVHMFHAEYLLLYYTIYIQSCHRDWVWCVVVEGRFVSSIGHRRATPGFPCLMFTALIVFTFLPTLPWQGRECFHAASSGNHLK